MQPVPVAVGTPLPSISALPAFAANIAADRRIPLPIDGRCGSSDRVPMSPSRGKRCGNRRRGSEGESRTATAFRPCGSDAAVGAGRRPEGHFARRTGDPADGRCVCAPYQCAVRTSDGHRRGMRRGGPLAGDGDEAGGGHGASGVWRQGTFRVAARCTGFAVGVRKTSTGRSRRRCGRRAEWGWRASGSRRRPE